MQGVHVPPSIDGFGGVIGRTHHEAEPWWPEIPQPAQDSPNIVVILLDDTGFAHFGCYGSTIETPNVDRLAAGGLRSVSYTHLTLPTILLV